MRNKFGKLFMALGIGLILGALGLFGYNQYQAHLAAQASVNTLSQLVEQAEAAEETAPTLVPDIPRDLLTEEEKRMKEMLIEGHSYIGFLTLPTLDLELPIMSEWSEEKLQIAPCRYHGSLRANDLVLMAHNFDKHFGRIKNLELGDQVLFTDMDGNVTVYQVVAEDIVDPYAVKEIIAGDFDLTLFTCTYGGQSRVVAYCDRAEN